MRKIPSLKKLQLSDFYNRGVFPIANVDKTTVRVCERCRAVTHDPERKRSDLDGIPSEIRKPTDSSRLLTIQICDLE